MADPLLTVENVRAGYGGATVLYDLTFTLPRGGSLAVLGRNGVGKSTLLLTLMGFTALRGGRILLNGRDISTLAPWRRSRAGLGWIAQERDIFASLTVEENLTVAATPGRWTRDAVFAMFPRLRERRRNLGTQLSGGEQQMLAIGRALMTNPQLLLLDEPMEGLAPVIVEEIAAAIGAMTADDGLAIILVEQHADVALALTQSAMVIERGVIIHSAASAGLLADPAKLQRLIGLKLIDAG